ncbi:Ubiquitin carboxyl-terminal hydrolase 34 [Acipenser ruthenus]|uniref:Ubiquitin carboxyl-terminal hydrolase 34 n=1 Tax=Acipenser ruthenus TaxID=7906 RepID=A0A662YQ13_ACIRT|nr:Ubiquitin carboxyl-terminal hydrolase 34 [Acipenser ruthenus]
MPAIMTMLADHAARQLLDFSQKLDINLLDSVVNCLYHGEGPQQRMAQEVLTHLKEHPDAWTRVDTILEFSQNMNTKFTGHCKRIKKYVVGLIIKTSSDATNVEKEKVYIGKLNMILVQILKQEWPKHWPTFISDIVGASRTSESLCQNNMIILKLLSEEVFDFSSGQMTQVKAKHLKDSMCNEFSQIFQLCQFVMMLPLNTNIRLAYSNGKDDEQNFIQNLSLFLCTFLKEHGQLVEKRLNLRETLMEGRLLMVSRMAKPEEVLVVENDQGEVVREFMKDTDSINLYKNMRETLETHDGVQDMACDTFIKIAQKCRRHFVQVQVGEVMPFIDEILNNINTIICDLQPQQVHTFYEAVGYMIGAQTDQTVQEHLIEKYMLLPNQVWDSIIQQATKNVDILKDPETVKQLGSILKTNVAENFVPPLLDAVLIDYQRNVPAAREPEVLSTMATIVNKLGGHITAEIPQIFDAVFECTLNMINKDFEEYPEHRTNFFLLLQAVNLHCFPAFLAIPPAQFKLVLDSIIWAFKHTMRNVADTGLQILYTLLQNVAQEEAAAQSFYQTYFCEILQHIFSVVTDTSHTAGLTMHASILTYMFNLVEEGKINAALNPATPVNNQMFIQEYVANLLKSAFPHLQEQCLCCFKEYKHLEVFNQVVYALINLVVAQVQALQDQLYKSCTNDTDSDWADVTQQSDEPVNVERDSNEEDGETEGQKTTESKPDSSKACGRTGDVSKSPDPFSAWNTEEKEKLLLCVAKIFQIQFPLYTAYKHNTHPTIEDVEVPLHLLRYVCLFCGKHGLSLMKDCFESGTPETLPFPIAHAFITVVSNIRIWLHIPAVMQHIIPFRTYVIRYLCKLSDQELRQSAARNMADLMWSTVKEPLDTALCFDKESLDLAFKYFMSPTLTMRLAGLSQITLKHCSRYIHDLFPSLIKNLDPVPLRHLLNLVSALHPSAHTEQTLYLASMLIKALWNNALAAKAQLSKQSSFASLLNTNLPMGNKKGSPAASPESSDNSDTHHSGGSDIEMDEQIMNRAKRVQQRLSDTEESMQGSSDETANSGEDASSGPGSSSGRSDGSSNEVNSSHASQSAGSPGSEVHSEDMADSEALKEEEEEEEEEEIEVERGRSPQKESRNPELRKRKLESHAIPICLGEPQGATDRSGTNSGTGKDLPFNPEAVSSVDSRMRLLDASSHPEDPDHDMAEEISSTQLSQGSQDPCISRPGDFLGEAIGNELFNCRRFIGPQHHHHHPHHHHPHHHAHEGYVSAVVLHLNCKVLCKLLFCTN